MSYNEHLDNVAPTTAGLMLVEALPAPSAYFLSPRSRTKTQIELEEQVQDETGQKPL